MKRHLFALCLYASCEGDVTFRDGIAIHEKTSCVVGRIPGRRLSEENNVGDENFRNLQVADLYGSINDYAYYFVDILVGTPPRRESVILDSGSSLLGFPCTDCGSSCGRHLDPPFNPSLSSSARFYTCADSRCLNRDTCSKKADASVNTCKYNQIYSEGSSIEGYFFSDLISFKDSFVRYDYIGCHTRETALFVTQKASGILGVSFPKGGKQPTVMDQLLASPTVNSKVFSLCAAEDGGQLSVGGYNNTFHKISRSVSGSRLDTLQATPLYWLANLFSRRTGRLRGSELPVIRQSEAAAVPSQEIVWTRLVSDSAYSIGVSRLWLENSYDSIRGGFGEVLVDSGTTYTYFPQVCTVCVFVFVCVYEIGMQEVYTRVAQHLLDYCKKYTAEHRGICVAGRADLVCFNFADVDDVKAELDRIPSFFLDLSDGGRIEWKAESWLFRKTEK